MSKERLIYEIDGEVCIDDEAALQFLLERGLASIGYSHLADQHPDRTLRVSATPALTVAVDPGDVFMWGASSSGAIEDEEDFIRLIRHLQADNRWGAIRWLCIKENQQPQEAIVRAMQKENAWDEALAALGENHFEKAWRERYESARALAGQGLTAAAIAEELDLSEQLIKNWTENHG